MLSAERAAAERAEAEQAEAEEAEVARLGPPAMRLVERLVQREELLGLPAMRLVQQEELLGRRAEQRPVQLEQRRERRAVLRVRRPVEWAPPPVARSAQLATQPAVSA